MNLTDGIDGLAAGTGIIALLTFTAMPRHVDPLSREIDLRGTTDLDLAILGAALIGGAIGFLWYNAFPAEVFMGDTGSMAIGGALGAFAMMTKTEVLLLLIGGIFLIEALSVMIQVFTFKYRDRRVFLMAPIHHHFEMKAWSETKIMVRFWILAAILCAAAFALYYRYYLDFLAGRSRVTGSAALGARRRPRAFGAGGGARARARGVRGGRRRRVAGPRPRAGLPRPASKSFSGPRRSVCSTASSLWSRARGCPARRRLVQAARARGIPVWSEVELG